MSEIQSTCTLLLIFIDFIFNFVGWGAVSEGCTNPLLVGALLLADLATIVALILGAMGVFG